METSMQSILEATHSAQRAPAKKPSVPEQSSTHEAAATTGGEHADRAAEAPRFRASAPEAQDTELDIGIVILSYNTVDLLRDCLNSVLAARTYSSQERANSRHGSQPQIEPPKNGQPQNRPQTSAAPESHPARFAVCVVDNASTDGSAEMVAREFPTVQLIANTANTGYTAGNNLGLRWFGFDPGVSVDHPTPRYALLLNPDTCLPPGTLDAMLRFMDASPEIGAAGPRVRRPDGSLDLACRRSFPTPQVSAYRMVGLSRLLPQSRRFNAYNLAYLPEEGVYPVDSVTGAFMLVRREAIAQAGLLDERFFMYGEDLDWAKRIKEAGWEIWYNGQVAMTHVKEASSRQSIKARIDFYEAMWLFYQKHYRATTAWWLDTLIRLGIVCSGSLDIARHLWRYCRKRP